MQEIIRHTFPDLAWLKEQVTHRFASGQGWPNVILNVSSTGCYRPDIKGPLSLFMNIRGQSVCGVDNHQYRIPEDCYFISNQHQPYTLTIDPAAPVETFNIHFGEGFLENVYDGLTSPASTLLDNPRGAKARPLHFFNKLYAKDKVLNQLMQRLYCYSREVEDGLAVEEVLAQLAVYLLSVHRQVNQQVFNLPPVKHATQLEAYRRLAVSVDLMHNCYQQSLTLDELAGAACLSKFHYLRLFRACFHQSPYQYLTQLRIEKAKNKLQRTNLPINEIAIQVGFENLSSFSRIFSKWEKQSPTVFRARKF